MGWQDLLSETKVMVLPWLGERRLVCRDQVWRLQGRLPPEYGWYTFQVSGGRTAKLRAPAEPNPDFEKGHKVIRGYLMGDRLIPDTARIDPAPEKLASQTLPVLLVEPGLERFARAVVIPLATETGLAYLYMRQEFPIGSETEVEIAYQDRLPSVEHIAGVTPALDLAFRWLSFQRVEQERREREEAARRAEEERKQAAADSLREALRNDTGVGRRALAAIDFNAAARQALALSGAELLDTRPSPYPGEMIVQYRLQQRRLECVVDKTTLRVIDSGVCLTDERTGEKGDTYLVLESLPGVIAEALRLGRLVVYRHVPGDHFRDGGDEEDWLV